MQRKNKHRESRHITDIKSTVYIYEEFDDTVYPFNCINTSSQSRYSRILKNWHRDKLLNILSAG